MSCECCEEKLRRFRFGIYWSTQNNRYFSAATYDLEAIHTIINTSPVVHVSFQPSDPSHGPFPVVLPMIGQMGSYEHPSAGLEDPLDCYLHGYISARMMNHARSESQGEESQGLPMSICATKFDGMVMAVTPFNHSYNYRSAVLFGYATPVTDKEEKLWAMDLITESVVPGRWNQTRLPPDGGEISSTMILKVRIVSGSGKIREGGAGNEKKDLERDDVMDNVWTGVIPVWQTIGEPIPAEVNRVKDLPQYLRTFVEDGNSESEEYAIQAARPKAL